MLYWLYHLIFYERFQKQDSKKKFFMHAYKNMDLFGIPHGVRSVVVSCLVSVSFISLSLISSIHFLAAVQWNIFLFAL